MKNREAIFVRHNFDKPGPKRDSVLKQIWDNNEIAFIYEDVASTDPKDYKDKASKNAFEKLNRYCHDGVIVGADYHLTKERRMMVGEILQGTKIQVKNYDGYAFYKVVKLKNVKKVSYIDYPRLLSGQVPMVALSRWPSAKDVLQAILTGGALPYVVGSLDVNQLEVVCYEYLRRKNHLDALIAPIGRTMRDIDILAMSAKSENVIAQVTFGKDVKAKADALLSHKSSKRTTIRYFFCPKAAIPAPTQPAYGNIKFVAIEDVFSYFGQNSPMIMRMLGS